MSDNLKVLFGFLGGTIVAVEGGYKVLQDHSPDKIYQRLSDAKWFLALRWCDHCSTPAAILNNAGQGRSVVIDRKHTPLAEMLAITGL